MKLSIHKHLRFLFYTAVFSLAALSGCQNAKKDAPTQTPSDTENTAAEINTESELFGEEKDTVVWKIYFSDYIDIWQEPLNRLLKEKGAPYQVKIEAYHAIGDEPLEQAVNTLEKMKQADERADVIAVPATAYTVMADRTLLFPLDDFLESSQGRKIAGAMTERDLARCRYKGVTYGVSAHLRTIGGIAYDKELLNKYDIDASDLSSDIFENEAVLMKIKEGGNVIPYVYNDDILYSLGLWKTDASECLAYTQAEEAVNIFETTELREMLFKLKDFKDKGLLGFASESGTDSFFATDQLSHREDPFAYSSSYVDNTGQTITTEYVVVPNMKRPQIAPYWGDAQTAIASWSQNRKNALDFLTRLYTDPDIANLILYGNEGKEYTLKNSVAKRLPSNLLWVLGEHYTNALIAFSQEDTAADKMAFQENYYKQCEPNIPDGFRFDSAPVAEEINAVNAVYYKDTEGKNLSDEIRNLFRLETEDIDAALSEINTKLKAAGIDRIAEEFKQQLAEWRAEYEK